MTARTETPWRYRLALFKSKCIYQYVPGRLRAMKALYGSMLSAGDLCFDLGSHIGNRVDVLTSLSCKVVALVAAPVSGELSAPTVRGQSRCRRRRAWRQRRAGRGHAALVAALPDRLEPESTASLAASRAPAQHRIHRVADGRDRDDRRADPRIR